MQESTTIESYPPISFQCVGFWRRVIAYIVDSVILNVVFWLIVFLSSIGQGTTGFASVGLSLLASSFIAPLIFSILSWLYFALFEASDKQATIGKMALGMKVVDTSGEKISFWRATGRHFAKVISALIVMIGFLMVGWTKKKQGLHDIMASTLVIREQQT